MKTILKMKNPIQPYAWGSHTVIAELLSSAVPSREPQAELWMGAHPKAPSQVYYRGRWVSLPEMIRKYPAEILGKETAHRYHGQLPYLFKVLAAARPLSIQAHPDKDQAVCGFARENRLAIAPDAPERNYKDDNHKPEILCALTPFWAVCGFRPVDEVLALLDRLCLEELSPLIERLRRQPDAGQLKAFVQALLTLPAPLKTRVIQSAVARVRRCENDIPEFHWMLTLEKHYPNDIGALSTLLLNLIQLQPGQSIFLDAGIPHAYLEGAGIELMANSDNVLRGGLTEKHVDVPELMQIMRFEPGRMPLVEPVSVSASERIYPCRAEEFRLSAIEIQGDLAFTSSHSRGVEILLCTQGQAVLVERDASRRRTLSRGESVLIPATHPGYRLEGQATLFKAGGPRI